MDMRELKALELAARAKIVWQDAAMVNEVLCKLVCHNLCCLIQSQCELGIEATFWDAKEEGPRDVLPLVRRG